MLFQLQKVLIFRIEISQGILQGHFGKVKVNQNIHPSIVYVLFCPLLRPSQQLGYTAGGQISLQPISIQPCFVDHCL
jgi:hypothetical protein